MNRRLIWVLPTLILFSIYPRCFLVRYHRPLDPVKLNNSKTALVINTEWIDTDEKWLSNKVNIQFYTYTKHEKMLMQYVSAMEQRHGRALFNHLSSIAKDLIKRANIPNLSLDYSQVFNASDFPVKYPDELYYSGTVPRDYSSLAKQGYTHILRISFGNTFDFLPDKDKRYKLYFGFDGNIFDIRPAAKDNESDEQRDKRSVWRYWIQQVATEKSQESTTRLLTGYQLKITKTWKVRECLNIVCLYKNNPSSLDELFGGKRPLYIEVYKRAAIVNLTHAIKYMKTGVPQEATIITSIDNLFKAIKIR